MKRIKFLLPVLAIVAMATTSCDDEAKAVPPVHSTITLTPSTCAPGDSVTATVEYATKGENWYYYLQTMTIGNNTVMNEKKHTTQQPVCKFKAPMEPGTYKVNYSASVSLTAGKTLFAECKTVSGTLTVKE